MKKLTYLTVVCAALTVISLGIKNVSDRQDAVEKNSLTMEKENALLREKLADNAKKFGEENDRLSKTIAKLNDHLQTARDDLGTLQKEVVRVKNISPDIYRQADYVVNLYVNFRTFSGTANDWRGAGTIINYNEAIYIWTNYHNISSDENEIITGIYAQPNLPGAYQHRVEVLGYSAETDQALLKFADGFQYDGPVATLGNSDTLTPGMPILGIGSPLGMEFAVTSGVIESARVGMLNPPISHRFSAPQVIIHTAPYTGGFSGGPIISLADGTIVGMNQSILFFGLHGIPTNTYVAVPVNELKKLLPQLTNPGAIKHSWLLGLTAMNTAGLPASVLPGNLRPKREGVMIGASIPTGAKEPLLKLGDIVLAVDGSEITTTSDLANAIFFRKPGEKILIRILRGQDIVEVTMTLDAYSDPF